jgi:hypothetical protein
VWPIFHGLFRSDGRDYDGTTAASVKQFQELGEWRDHESNSLVNKGANARRCIWFKG